MSEQAISSLQAQIQHLMTALQELQVDARRRADAGVPETVAQVLANFLASIPAAVIDQNDEASLITVAWENRRPSAVRKWTSTSGHASWRTTSQVCTTILDHFLLWIVEQCAQTILPLYCCERHGPRREASQRDQRTVVLSVVIAHRGRVIRHCVRLVELETATRHGADCTGGTRTRLLSETRRSAFEPSRSSKIL